MEREVRSRWSNAKVSMERGRNLDGKGGKISIVERRGIDGEVDGWMEVPRLRSIDTCARWRRVQSASWIERRAGRS